METQRDWDETRGNTTNDIVVYLSRNEITFAVIEQVNKTTQNTFIQLE